MRARASRRPGGGSIVSFFQMDRPANSDFLAFPWKIQSSLYQVLVHHKLKLCNEHHNYPHRIASSFRAKTRICTGNCWNSYEFQALWIRELTTKCPDSARRGASTTRRARAVDRARRDACLPQPTTREIQPNG
jgi:hypothetical protein